MADNDEEEMNRLYNEYVTVLRLAYENESDFCANRPVSKELAEKASDAYRVFDVARNKVLQKK